ncbi:MAG: 3-hexulose-6-phosphate synthase [Promethearchaeota archaeon]
MTYANKILRINLDTKSVKEESLDFEIVQQYLGGRGLGVKILYDELPPKIDPLSSANKIALMTGPMTGTISPTSSRWAMVFKSPLTQNTLNDSHCGGSLGIQLKKSGYDGIIIEGKADKPCLIHIQDSIVEILDATEFWGKDTYETQKSLKEKYDRHSVACIGIAGEKLNKFACVMNDARFAGRGGVGAIWGSKNLKAIVIKGTQRIKPVNEFAFKKISKKFLDTLKGHPVTGTGLGLYGTPILTTAVNKSGVLPVKNFQEGIFNDVRAIAGETLRELLIKQVPCQGCPIGCGRSFKFGDIAAHLEYESLWALGPNCGIGDLNVIFKASEKCNRYGLDTISTGNAIAWYMECGERGLVSDAPHFGEVDGFLKLIDNIALKQGVGALLSQGVRAAAAQIGQNSEDFACHIKGLEMPAYDPRGIKGMALSYATSNTGATHLKAYTVIQEILSTPHYVDPLAEEGKAALVKEMQDVFAVLDSAEWCKFTSMAVFSTLKCEVDIYAKMLTTATGFFIDSTEFKKIGERIYNLERLFNYREGLTRDDDQLPKRFLTETLPEGPAKGQVVDNERLLTEFYRLRGWEDDGSPSDRKLEELGIKPLHTSAKLQVALDLRDMDEALKIAKSAVEGGVDWIECGTPLVKSVGMDIVRKIRELYPHKTIVCDLKTMDTGFLESEMAYLAGADIVCILGIAPDSTIIDAVGAGKKFGIKIHADLIGVLNPIERAIELEKLGVDYIGLHIGIDTQLRSGFDKVPYPTLKKLKESIKIPVAVAGGLNAETIPKAVATGADILIVGGAITRSANPAQATRRLKEKIEEASRKLSENH